MDLTVTALSALAGLTIGFVFVVGVAWVAHIAERAQRSRFDFRTAYAS